MSLLPPISDVDFRSNNERQPLLDGQGPPSYSQAFPGEPPTVANTGRTQQADVDIQAVARGSDVTELRIEDTSRRSRSVKGAINRINYWAANSNSCYHANFGILGKELMPCCCCGGGQGSYCSDIVMLCIYIWFSVISPAVAVLGIVQFFFLIFNEGVPFEWAILLNDIVALATLVYIADILRRNMRRFEENMFCMKIPQGLLPGSINAFMSLTISNINRIQLLGVHQRSILAAELRNREDATLHVMLYGDHYLSYVYRRPRTQLVVAISIMTVLTAAQIAGLVWFWDDFGSKLFSDIFT